MYVLHYKSAREHETNFYLWHDIGQSSPLKEHLYCDSRFVVNKHKHMDTEDTK